MSPVTFLVQDLLWLEEINVFAFGFVSYKNVSNPIMCLSATREFTEKSEFIFIFRCTVP